MGWVALPLKGESKELVGVGGLVALARDLLDEVLRARRGSPADDRGTTRSRVREAVVRDAMVDGLRGGQLRGELMG